MASESFDATDDNGNNVTGTVEVYRDPKGPYFDPTHEYYKNSRYADARFQYFNTRGACTIDPKVLSQAMQEAFATALKKFGISDPNGSKVADDVNASIEATRKQCRENADKYVSNETLSSTNWETGRAVGDLTAKAYRAVLTPAGGIQTVVARENSWPADDISARKTSDSDDRNEPILSRRVVAQDTRDNGVGSSFSSADGVDPVNLIQPTSVPLADSGAAIAPCKCQRITCDACRFVRWPRLIGKPVRKSDLFASWHFLAQPKFTCFGAGGRDSTWKSSWNLQRQANAALDDSATDLRYARSFRCGR